MTPAVRKRFVLAAKVALSLCAVFALAILAIQWYLNALQFGFVKREMADLRAIGAALDSYAQDRGTYPSLTRGPAARLVPFLVPKYLKALPDTDIYARPVMTESSAKGYILVCYGNDGQPDLGDSWAYSMGRTVHLKEDIVFQNGTFLRWPKRLNQ